MASPRRFRLAACCLGLLALVTASVAAQSLTPFPLNWVQTSARYFKLDADGSHAVIQRQTGPREELVWVSLDGRQQFVVFSQGLGDVYYRFDLSANAGVVAYSRPNNTLEIVTWPGGPPSTVTFPVPFAQPDQISLSGDGKWVACTLHRYQGFGNQIRRVDALFVAATDGSAVYKITRQPLLYNLFPFSFSLDGRKIAWVDGSGQGPMMADRDGTNAVRLPMPPGPSTGLGRVYLDTTASSVFYEVFNSRETAIWRFDVATRTFTKLDAGPWSLGYAVSRDGRRVRAEHNWNAWLLKENGPEKMFDYSRGSRVVGNWAWSHDGNVFVWSDSLSPYRNPVMIWHNSLTFGSPPPHRPGSLIRLELRSTAHAGQNYTMAASFATSPPLKDPRSGLLIPLVVDGLLRASLVVPTVFRNFVGALDADGRANAAIAVPNAPGLVGLVFFVAYVTEAGGRFNFVSDEVRVEIKK